MATADPLQVQHSAKNPSGTALLVSLSSMSPEQLEGILQKVAIAFSPASVVIATPDSPNDSGAHYGLCIVSAPQSNAVWTFTAADFVNAYQLAQKAEARAILMLGPECASLSSSGIRDLGNTAMSGKSDLAVACYDMPPRTGLVNSAILYPLTRALFANRIRFPLAIDLGLSTPMAAKLANVAQRLGSVDQGDALVWPVNEAAVAGLNISEVDVGTRTIPQPADPDINAILPRLTGSLFADIDLKAAYWQRPRLLPPARTSISSAVVVDSAADLAPMLDAFRFAYTNLRDIWSLVLPPNSLLGLKRLSITDASAFRMPDSLWARIVYDFLLAYRLRTINRGHLQGAMIPLYLAWVASHFNITAAGLSPEQHVDNVCAAFETEKPYLVSRWRWPDRFNP
jgi:hypothetical protein